MPVYHTLNYIFWPISAVDGSLYKLWPKLFVTYNQVTPNLHGSRVNMHPAQQNTACCTLFFFFFYLRLMCCRVTFFDRGEDCDSDWMWALSHFIGREGSWHRPRLNHQTNFRSSGSSMLWIFSPTGSLGLTSRQIKRQSKLGQIKPQSILPHTPHGRPPTAQSKACCTAVFPLALWQGVLLGCPLTDLRGTLTFPCVKCK